MNEVVKQLGAMVGLPSLAPDEDGFCFLRIEDDTEVGIGVSPSGDRLVLFSVLEKGLPSHPSQSWLKKVLAQALNPLAHMDQPGIGYDPRFDSLVAYFTFIREAVEVPKVENRMLSLASWCREWKRNINVEEPKMSAAATERLPAFINFC